MARIEATQTPHQVFNEFDRHGLILNLPRLRGERNTDYKWRLFDVFVNRASSTYRGLINGITRELGLKIIDTVSIQPLLDSNGDTLVPAPAVVFQDTKCYVYSDFCTGIIDVTLDRFDRTDGAWTLQELVDQLNGTGYLLATLLEDAEPQKRSMTIFNQSTVGIVPSEEISGAGSVIVLENRNLIPGTVSVRSDNLTRLVQNETDLRRPGDYLIKHKEGLILARGAPAPGSFVRYSYRDDSFVAESSPVILHNIQSDDFRTKMFERVCDDQGEECNGLPNVFGADIINELMSVFPANWG